MGDFNIDMLNSQEMTNNSQCKYLLKFMEYKKFKFENHTSTTKNLSLLD